MRKLIPILSAVLLASGVCTAQHTSHSLFWRYDGKQVSSIVSMLDNQYRGVGHHGGAVENQYMALRIYFNDSGAIDVYNKSGKIDGELGKYHWYPSDRQQAEEGAGCDEYYVGGTTGLGGIRLWDGEKEVRLKVSKGRIQNVGRTAKGCFVEMISKGVILEGVPHDILLRIDVTEDSRWAKVTAKELDGNRIRFVTGVNYHPGAQVRRTDGVIAVWGSHPANVSQSPGPIGGALKYRTSDFSEIRDTGKMLQLISVPSKELSWMIMSASAREEQLGNSADFFSYTIALPATQDNSAIINK